MSILSRANYWSGLESDKFVDDIEAYYEGQPEKAKEIEMAFPHFALGFANGVYGDIAIPLFIAGASGALGSRIRNNIWWACGAILNAFEATSIETQFKLAAVFAMNNKAMVSGKIVGSIYLFSFYKLLRVSFGKVGGLAKMVANPAALAIIAFVSNRKFIEKLERSERLFVFAYVIITGDNNLTAFQGSEINVRLILERLSKEVDQMSVSELNHKYQELETLLYASKRMVSQLKTARRL